MFLLTTKSLPRRKTGVSQELAPQLPGPFRWDSETSDISAVLSRSDNTHHTSDQQEKCNLFQTCRKDLKLINLKKVFTASLHTVFWEC